MSAHMLLNRRPAPMTMDGQDWFPAYYVHGLEEQLRGELRDKAAMKGYMASVRELWKTLHERYKDCRWAQSPDNFRKHALIRTGWCDSDMIVFDSAELALKAAPTIRYMAKMGHGYAITQVRDNVVSCTTAKSQKLTEMSKEDFEMSKTDVLDWCRGVVGV